VKHWERGYNVIQVQVAMCELFSCCACVPLRLARHTQQPEAATQLSACWSHGRRNGNYRHDGAALLRNVSGAPQAWGGGLALLQRGRQQRGLTEFGIVLQDHRLDV
jgi:hypothetical protein